MNLKRLEDSELVSGYIRGEEPCFEELLRRHQASIYRFIFLKVRNQEVTEDIFQETFIKIINTLHAGNYNEEGKFLPWAMRIAHNLVIDYFRRSGKVRFITESSGINEDFSIFSILSDKELNVQSKLCKSELEEQMVGLIEHLPKVQRDIVEMRIFRDMSFKEIAELEDISINTALGRMRYALINLRKLIEKHQLVVDID
jgi:RNA polymerase sigma-70 factor (ECF subfamily)